MTDGQHVKLGYKRLETDAEFVKRVRDKYPWYGAYGYPFGAGLDDTIWATFNMQRRIVEVFP